jgi:hypothetical protein
MAYQHGRFTVITVNAKDLSQYTKTSTLELDQDVHDTTGYGSTAHTKMGGLTDASFTMSGTYDSTASTGPRAALLSLITTPAGTTITVKPEGTGSGKPLDTFTGILKKYTQTAPVDDMVTWSADFEVSGAVASTTQP